MPAAVLTAEGDGPEDAALRREAAKRVHKLLARLDIGKRELLVLRFTAGLRAHQIVHVTGKSEAAIKKQLARTIHGLQEQYRTD